MKTEWTFTAESYLDQLSRAERSKVLHAIELLPTEWDALKGKELNRLSGGQPGLYSLRAGPDLRIVLRVKDEVIYVVDVVRKGQVEGLRGLSRSGGAVSR